MWFIQRVYQSSSGFNKKPISEDGTGLDSAFVSQILCFFFSPFSVSLHTLVLFFLIPHPSDKAIVIIVSFVQTSKTKDAAFFFFPFSTYEQYLSRFIDTLNPVYCEVKQERAEMLTEIIIFYVVQQLAVKIAQAAECRNFARARREEQDSRAARKKRKQITWGCVSLFPFMSILFVWQLSKFFPFPARVGGANLSEVSANFKLCNFTLQEHLAFIKTTICFLPSCSE